MYSLLSLRMISSRSVHILNQPLVHCVFHLVITEVLSLQRAYPRWSVTVNPKDGKCGSTYVNNPIHSSVLAKHLEFRKREELFCANDGAERERERERRRLHNCQVLLVVHYRCCLWLGTVLRVTLIFPCDKGRYCCKCLKASAVGEVSDNEMDE